MEKSIDQKKKKKEITKNKKKKKWNKISNSQPDGEKINRTPFKDCLTNHVPSYSMKVLLSVARKQELRRTSPVVVVVSEKV